MLQPTVSLMLDDESRPCGRVGVAVVGLDGWGPNLLRVLSDSMDAEVRWICDVDSSQLAKYRRRHPEARVTTRVDRTLADPGVDAVVLATPLEEHYELAVRALEAGKHVFVKSPLAGSAELADDLASTARERRLIVMCDQTPMYSPPVRTVKRIIDSGSLGDIHYISSARLNLGRDGRAGSVIWDLGPHDFSILMYWLSEMPTTVRALGRDSMLAGVADVAFITMNFASGIVANVELSSLAPHKLRRTMVVGSERTVVYDDGPEPVRLFDSGVGDRGSETFGGPARYRGGDIVSPNIEFYEPLELQLSEFMGAIRAGDRMHVETTLARNVVWLAEAAHESLRLGGADVSLSVYSDEAPGQLAPRRGLAAV
jgi:predicted dehydrogenase